MNLKALQNIKYHKTSFQKILCKRHFERKIYYGYNVNIQPNSTTPLKTIRREIVFVVYRFIILYTMYICIHVC